jgi:hypothetical protein
LKNELFETSYLYKIKENLKNSISHFFYLEDDFEIKNNQRIISMKKSRILGFILKPIKFFPNKGLE